MASGEIQLEAFEAGGSSASTWQAVEQEIRKAAGMGPFTAANMLQLMGYYSHIPCDSETLRHLKKTPPCDLMQPWAAAAEGPGGVAMSPFSAWVAFLAADVQYDIRTMVQS